MLNGCVAALVYPLQFSLKDPISTHEKESAFTHQIGLRGIPIQVSIMALIQFFFCGTSMLLLPHLVYKLA
uniref:WD repeat-containing protein 3 n=1 Tax=Rhizophora mucronata TaxID=61149 RepID=A0A2P2JBA3_RHIMU